MEEHKVYTNNEIPVIPVNEKPSFYTGLANSPRIDALGDGSILNSDIIPILRIIKVKTTDIDFTYGAITEIKHGLREPFEVFGRINLGGTSNWLMIPTILGAGPTIGGQRHIDILYSNETSTFIQMFDESTLYGDLELVYLLWN